MLDTVTFVLHRINKQIPDLNAPRGLRYYNDFNRLLYERLLDYENKFIKRTRKFINEGVVDEINDDYFKRKSINSYGIVKRQGSIVESLEKKDFFFYPVHGNITTASSDSSCKFSINENSDSLKFELSIPKYFYGHNIAQFVPNIESERYRNKPFVLREFNGQLKEIKIRLIEFIVTFFNDLSILLGMTNFNLFKLEDIEIKRLDLCYNQFFASKEMAIDYLLAQKKIYHSRVKKNTIVVQDYDTSFAYRHSTDGFYFKIYHKGSEFLNSDLNKIHKINKEKFYNNPKLLIPATEIFKKHFPKVYDSKKGRVEDSIFEFYNLHLNSNEYNTFIDEIEALFVFKTSHLIKEANKVLRYEMSFTNTYLSTIYKRDVFRKDCPDWKFLKKSHSLIKRYNLHLERNKERARQFKIINNITKDMFQEYKIIQGSLMKKHEFFLFTEKKLKKHETSFPFMDSMEFRTNWAKAKILETKEATFSDSLFELIFKRFKEEIDFFQIKEVEETNTTIELIEKYNKEAQQRTKNYKNAFGETAYKKLTANQKRKKNLSQIQTSRLKIVLDRFNEGKSFDSIVHELALKKSAIYTLKYDLEKFKIYKNTVKTKYSFRNIKTDFSKYYENFLIDRSYASKLFHNPKLLSFDALRKSNHFSLNTVY
ncbi:MAG: hypothetical protein CMP76_12220 [Flavobacterium sp.]|uniref:hypothetical protein n=1 Tax=Flavobacterium sp. TaxID=239 RepID=UPI000C3BA548|nr:hypothetical protein [Flavobacterium sp.]MBF04051.1 hypothetical protein [Flavobacterium sp.]|tara:strand:+ start:1093 stop:3048 length:1956 start_codon:yes stop_codon:yes gene_type:complete